MRWDTSKEQRLIREFGGTPLRKTGTDGTIYNGKPVEVRAVRKDHRFRIQKDTHAELKRRHGFYIFAAPGRSSLLYRAADVDKMLPAGRWYKDRGYPHKFLTISDVWQ